MSLAWPPVAVHSGSSHRESALAAFRRVRSASNAMCVPLRAEEYRLQPIADVSPPWWNLGHTSWFFVRNVLAPFGGQMTPEDEQFDYLLNSYYESLGKRLPHGQRGAVSRPTTDEIYEYRASVDERVETLIQTIDDDRLEAMLAVLTIGLQHEQQHQELFYTEIKFIRYQNITALREPYIQPRSATVGLPGIAPDEVAQQPPRFIPFEPGLFQFGNLEGGWCWDNELPVHRQYLEPFAIAITLVTNREFLDFIDDGGYKQPLLWLDNGWKQVQSERWQAPLYWELIDGRWWQWTLAGMAPLALDEPVSHVSFYEADAFARWLGDVRLPSEREWEHAGRTCSSELHQLDGCLWQWTNSYYEPYPGYQPFAGALAEYNGKFMDNQRVLRGASCVTPPGHYRLSYRNFWPAATRFQFTGIRLARSI